MLILICKKNCKICQLLSTPVQMYQLLQFGHCFHQLPVDHFGQDCSSNSGLKIGAVNLSVSNIVRISCWSKISALEKCTNLTWRLPMTNLMDFCGNLDFVNFQGQIVTVWPYRLLQFLSNQMDCSHLYK